VILGLVDDAQRAGARLSAACHELGIAARTVERWRARPDDDDRRLGPHHTPSNALSAVERARVVEVMTSAKYAGVSPKQLVPALADEGVYLASESTLYRLRHQLGLTRRRRIVERTHVTRANRVHQATGPNQVWSWDITYLPSTVRGRYFYLYLVMDVWSRRIVGWTVAENESASVAANLVQRICDDDGIDTKGLVLHSDNGRPMRGATMIATLQWLGIVPSFSRPHVSNDNPYSEALFRTLKHTPAYPQLPFASVETARSWVARFVTWYNGEHRHSGIRYVTPDQRHFDHERQVLARRHAVYERARRRKPERWSRSTRNWTPVATVVLNPEPTLRAA
jgi:transposase InsO family protein